MHRQEVTNGAVEQEVQEEGNREQREVPAPEPSSTTAVVPQPRRPPRSRRVVVRRPIRIYEEDETIDLACQEGRCRHMWHDNPECDDVFADHDSHNGDRRLERALRPGSVRSSERIAEVEDRQADRMADFVQRVLNNDTSESDDDLPPPVVVCTKENCNCVAHSGNSLFASSQSNDMTFEATPTMLSRVSKSLETSDSGKICTRFPISHV